uniref:LOW QUALITY PROTEIN: FH1/FH2 domain-containing protein 3-like n=1 Tax=Petromyzon marinus TaxID=7757 RepID=A0AAJ7WXD9_PETMA|nr:LOW QUALITY PROTEIN: FH1/FH2 domain-containing protein 3-like [Petromyzon marinus]
MATLTCRVQFLDDTDPFSSTNFPEPTRPPTYTFLEDTPLIEQIAGVHRLLKAPHKLDDCALQLSHNGTYLDLDSTLGEQRDELEGFFEDSGRSKKQSIVLRTQLSVRVNACIEKLYNSTGRELRRALFSLKQIFQDDKDLVHEFVNAEGLTCLIRVGDDADQNYQNYILRALGQIMLYVDGMNGVIAHNDTVQWLYSLIASKFRLVVKTALKLLVVFVEYTESNAPLFIKAVNTTDRKSGVKPWSNILAILDEKDGIDTELLVFAMTLLNKTLAVLPDQDTFYDVTDCLEEQGMEAIAQRHLAKRGGDRDLAEQFDIYEVALRLEDGDTESGAATPASCRKERRRTSLTGAVSAAASSASSSSAAAGTGGGEKRGLERRRSRRHNSAGRGRSPTSPVAPSALPAGTASAAAGDSAFENGAARSAPPSPALSSQSSRSSQSTANGRDDGDVSLAVCSETNDCCFEADAKSSPGSALTKSLPLVQNASSCMPAPVQRLSMTPSPLPPSSTPSSPSPPPAAALPAPAATLRSRAATPARHAANVSPAALPVRLPYVPKSPFHLFSYEPMDKPASLRERQDEAAAAATAAGTPVAASLAASESGSRLLEPSHDPFASKPLRFASSFTFTPNRYSAGVNYNGNVYGTPGARSYGSPSSPASQAAGSQYSQNHSSEAADGKNSNKAMDSSARAAAGLLSSSYKQHQESLAAERERRRRERDERLQRIEREERNKYNSREYMEERERLRREKEERNRYLERIAAEEREKELRNRTKVRMELNLTLQSPSTNASPVTLVSQSPGTPSACPSPTPVRSAESPRLVSYSPSPTRSQSPALAPSPPPSPAPSPAPSPVTCSSPAPLASPARFVSPAPSPSTSRPATPAGIPAPPPAARVPSTPSSSLRLADAGETPEEAAEETAEEPAAEEVAPLSAKERENEAVNEKENCSASSSSSASSTLERDRAEEEPESSLEFNICPEHSNSLSIRGNESFHASSLMHRATADGIRILGLRPAQMTMWSDANSRIHGSRLVSWIYPTLWGFLARTQALSASCPPEKRPQEKAIEEESGEATDQIPVQSLTNGTNSEPVGLGEKTEETSKNEPDGLAEGVLARVSSPTIPEGGGARREIAAARDATAVSPDKPSGPRAFAERFGRVTSSEQDEEGEKEMPPVAPPPPRKESDQLWEQMLAKTHELRIKDMDFTDLNEEDDVDMLDFDNLLLRSGDFVSLPPPPPVFPSMASVLFSPPPPPGCPPTMPPPSSALTGLILPPPPLFASPAHQAREGTPGGPGSPALAHSLKKKKTVRLFWSEVRHTEWQHRNHRYGKSSLWASLDPVEVDTNKLEILFESKSKELPVTKRSTTDGKRQELIVLDSKRSNAINIGLTVLPPPRTIKTAILNFDEYALNKEGIEKLLTMIPTEEEKQKITEAQLVNPDVPLGSAEQFLLTLSSISELSARLQLWAFKLDYETMEKEVAEPLQDIKEGMDQVEKNRTLRCILTTLLAVGNFLNGTNAKGFELHYLEKVPEVKDTVHKQSLLHHVCNMVVEKFPDTTDLYSEIGAITRSAKVDFDQVQENLNQMERRCRACWDHLKAIAKHETKPVLKTKMSEFLRDCAERIIILKIVHRRIVNRFHAFMLYIGHAPYSIRDVSITRFCRIVSEFALEYRTARERVLQQRLKRATHRERNKTRGKMITDTDDEEAAESGKFSGGSAQSPLAASASVPAVRRQLAAEDDAEHENMKAVLRTSVHASGGLHSSVPGTRTRARARASRGRVSTGSAPVFDDSPNATDDATDEIMDRIVKSATQAPCQRAATRERRRSRANRKSLRRTLKSGLTPEEAQALGLLGTAEMQV